MLVVFDLDGTICYRGRPLSAAMAEALDRLTGEGHEVVFASARPIRDLLPILPVHMRQAPMVGGNGGFVYKGGRAVAESPLPDAVAERILELLRHYEADYLIDGLWNYAYSGDPAHPIRRNVDPDKRARHVPVEELGKIVKAVALRSRDQEALRAEFERLPVQLYRHGSEAIIDVSPAGVDKWSGLQALGVKPGEFVAFGNDANDIPMFRQAARSVCVGDHGELRRFASDAVAGEEEAVVAKIVALSLELQRGERRQARPSDR